jgi:hypothetical protein
MASVVGLMATSFPENNGRHEIQFLPSILRNWQALGMLITKSRWIVGSSARHAQEKWTPEDGRLLELKAAGKPYGVWCRVGTNHGIDNGSSQRSQHEDCSFETRGNVE